MNREERKECIAKQKEAIKTEIVRLQEKIDGMGLSQKYTIKSMRIDNVQGHRDVCLYFKEKFEVYDKMWVGPGLNDYKVKKHKINFWAMADTCYYSGEKNVGDFFFPSPFGLGGCKWNGVDENGEDGYILDFPDMRAIATMLSQEYWIWLRGLDGQYSRLFELDRNRPMVRWSPQELFDNEFDKCWLAMSKIRPYHTTKTMKEYVDQFNNQIQLGLIYDSAVKSLPYNWTGKTDFSNDELNKRLFS